ncbi:MAG: HutD family protein [Pseudomonadota bacterium]
MKHLTSADYKVQPWANGRGQTVELLRLEQDGALQLRLSMATVAEDGAFSIFPGIERNLTVISGPGFDLQGDGLHLTCAPLAPVAFAGDVAVSATGTNNQPSDDFNVMTARHLPRPQVTVVRGPATLPAGGRLYLFALGAAVVNETALSRHDLVMTDGPARIVTPSDVIVVRVAGQDGQIAHPA